MTQFERAITPHNFTLQVRFQNKFYFFVKSKTFVKENVIQNYTFFFWWGGNTSLIITIH